MKWSNILITTTKILEKKYRGKIKFIKLFKEAVRVLQLPAHIQVRV